jgi:hypothetical protein
MANPPPSLDDLRVQARLTYRYWPIYLMLRLREIDQHLTLAQLAELGSLPEMPKTTLPITRSAATSATVTALLVEYGLLSESDLPPAVALPFLSPLAAADYRFQAGPTWSGQQFHPTWMALDVLAYQNNTLLHLELLRTTTDHLNDLKTAASTFTQMSADLSPNTALEAARMWAALHGSRALTWQPVTSAQLAALDGLNAEMTSTVQSASHPLPPHRRRGKGQFRAAHY